jgi:hypothetical protein
MTPVQAFESGPFPWGSLTGARVPLVSACAYARMTLFECDAQKHTASDSNISTF